MLYWHDVQGALHFIPLQGIRTKDVVERYRSLGSKFRLCIDVMTFDPKIRPAVLFAVGTTVICDTLDDARDLCFKVSKGK